MILITLEQYYKLLGFDGQLLKKIKELDALSISAFSRPNDFEALGLWYEESVNWLKNFKNHNNYTDNSGIYV